MKRYEELTDKEKNSYFAKFEFLKGFLRWKRQLKQSSFCSWEAIELEDLYDFSVNELKQIYPNIVINKHGVYLEYGKEKDQRENTPQTRNN